MYKHCDESIYLYHIYIAPFSCKDTRSKALYIVNAAMKAQVHPLPA